MTDNIYLVIPLTEIYPFLQVYIVMTDVWKHPSLYHESYYLSCVYGQPWGVLHLSTQGSWVLRNYLGCRVGQHWGTQAQAAEAAGHAVI